MMNYFYLRVEMLIYCFYDNININNNWQLFILILIQKINTLCTLIFIFMTTIRDNDMISHFDL